MVDPRVGKAIRCGLNAGWERSTGGEGMGEGRTGQEERRNEGTHEDHCEWEYGADGLKTVPAGFLGDYIEPLVVRIDPSRSMNDQLEL